MPSLRCLLVLLCLLSHWAGRQSAWAQSDWPRFRGEHGDGHVHGFPSRPFTPRLLWRTALPTQGIGGVAATEDFVVVSSRAANDKEDVFACLDPVSGGELWRLTYAAPGQLDYGNSPRATPLIADPVVYLLGAMGDLHCVDIDSGDVRWHKHLVNDLGGVLPVWGYGWSPLLADNKLIIMPGGPASSIAALNPEDGSVLWQTAGQPTAYASPVVANWNDKPQIVTYDKATLGGWDLASGKRLWSIQPLKPNDFNVPTPIILKDALLVVTENNGLRQYMVDPQSGFPSPEPTAIVQQITPDSHTPVTLANQIVCADKELIALDLDKQLTLSWRLKDRALRGHNSLIASDDQVLVMTQGGELLQVSVTAKKGEIVARHKFSSDARYVLAHPALVGEVLYLRAETSLEAWALW